MKYLLIASLLILTACPDKGLNVKIYSSQPDRGAVRLQANEVVPYSETKNWIMLNEQDAETLLNYCLDSNKK